MSRNDNDLFDRLRQVGLRKQVAKALSEIGEGAGKKARNAARGAVSELRSVADEIERRMPGGTQTANANAGRGTASATASRRTATAGRRTATANRRPATATRRNKTTAAAKTTGRASRSRTRRSTPATATKASPSRAPRGQNKAKILESLKTGPKTASVIAKETGIGTGTVGSTLSKLATSGEVVKAERGYGLPGQSR